METQLCITVPTCEFGSYHLHIYVYVLCVFVIVRNRNEIAEVLLANNADPNIGNHAGVFPLLIAIALGNYNVLKVLLTSDKLKQNHQLKVKQSVCVHVLYMLLTIKDPSQFSRPGT